MPIIALLVAFAAVLVFAVEFHDTKSRIAVGLMLLTVALVLTYWTTWHAVHWTW